MARFRETCRTRTIMRCLPAGVFLLIGFLTLYVVQTTEFSFSLNPANDFIWVVGITELVVYVWVRAFSRVSLRSQIAALTVLYGIQLCFYLVIRIDGFMGDGRPIIVWRWTPGAKRVWADDNHSEDREDLGDEVDLAATSQYDCPGFRGSDRNGIVRSADLAPTWLEPPRQLWRQPIGLGWSSFAVVGDFCVTQEQRGDSETVVCYQLLTGREMWKHTDVARFDEVTGGVGPRATPTIHDGRVFALGATGILNCLDGRNGHRIWSKNILKDNNVENALFGMSGSPLIVNDFVVVSPGGRGASLAAYDLQTGHRVWADGDSGASYSSPQYATFGKRPQILSFNAEGLFGHDAVLGSVLWSFPWVSNPAEKNNVCQPVVVLDDARHPCQVFISSGYGQGCAMLEIVERNGLFAAAERWRNRNLKTKFSSVVRREQYIFGLDDKILVCLDLVTGKRCWKRGRYGYGQLVLAGDNLVIQAESGEVALVAARHDKFHELARFAALDDRTWSYPIISGDILVVRNDREAACYRLPCSD